MRVWHCLSTRLERAITMNKSSNFMLLSSARLISHFARETSTRRFKNLPVAVALSATG